MKRSAFTLVELIFVIVIIGVLAAVAVPKFTNLKQNAELTNVIQPLLDLNSSGGHSAYMNLTELSGIDPADINMSDLYKFTGKGWTVSGDSATYSVGDLTATLKAEDNGTVTATLECNANSKYEAGLKAKGFDCDTNGKTYSIDLTAE